MKTYTLAIAWNWEFDRDFVAGIERECAIRGISTYRVDSYNIQQTLNELRAGNLAFDALIDRASDADPEFLPLVHLMNAPSTLCINPYDRVINAIDKATMHLELITHGIDVPFTIILPPYNKKREIEIPQAEFERLGAPFVIKPANTTGGGTGVIMNGRTVQDIMETRLHHLDDKYLLQEMIIPRNLDGKRAWFRVYSVFDQVIPCWWDDRTHRYSILTPEEEHRFGLENLRHTIQVIRQICMLDFFSSEIAVTESGKFVAVDYVNEVCDMRLQSKYFNGAPDQIVHRIEQLIAEHVGYFLQQRNQAGLVSAL